MLDHAPDLVFDVSEDRRRRGNWIVHVTDRVSVATVYTVGFNGPHAEMLARRWAAEAQDCRDSIAFTLGW